METEPGEELMPGDMMGTGWSDLVAFGVAVVAVIYLCWSKATGGGHDD